MPVARTRARTHAAVAVTVLLALAASLFELTSAPRADAAGSDGESCVYAAHRGGKQPNTVENSARAFRAALAHNADYLEMDVQVTKDGWFVIMHDETIDRVSNGTGRVSNKTWAQLSRVRLNDGQRIATLKSVLAMAQPTNAQLLLELKWIPNSRFAKLKRRIDEFDASRVVVNSFSSYVVDKFHGMYPGIRTALDVNKQISVAKARSYGGVMPDNRHVTDAWLASMKGAGVPVYLWTVDTTKGWQRFDDKVTLVLTNRDADYDAWRRTHCS
jgi:glycerophosphoryl diester phosphodiesterase